MRTATAPTRRRAARGPDCDDRPRLWGDEPAAAATVAPELPAAVASVAPMAAPEGPTVAPTRAPDRRPTGALAVIPVPAPAARMSAPARTLEDLIAGTWDELIAGEPAACPVCAASMAPRWSAGAGAVGGRCGGCGTTLE